MSRIKLLKDVADDMSALAESTLCWLRPSQATRKKRREPIPQLTLPRGCAGQKSQAGLTKGVKALSKSTEQRPVRCEAGDYESF